MTWMRLDDGFDTHPKVLSLVNKGDPLNVWVRLLAWAGRQRERDGRVPRVVGLAYGTPKALARLVEVGLYDVTPDGWAIHDFEEYAAKGPGAGDPSDLSRKRAEAGRKGGIARVSRLQEDQPPEATGQATEQATAKQTDFASSNLLQANEAIASVRAGAPAPARAPVPIPSRPDPVPPPTPNPEPDPVVAVLAKSSDLKGEGVDLVRLAGALRGEAAAAGYSEARLVEVLPYALDELATTRIDQPTGKGSTRYVLSVVRRVARIGVLESELERRASLPERPGGASSAGGPSVSKSLLALVAPKVAQ